MSDIFISCNTNLNIEINSASTGYTKKTELLAGAFAENYDGKNHKWLGINIVNTDVRGSIKNNITDGYPGNIAAFVCFTGNLGLFNINLKNNYCDVKVNGELVNSISGYEGNGSDFSPTQNFYALHC